VGKSLPKNVAQRLDKPVPITEQVWPEETVPMVSIFCITYNHEKFIRDAIEGFLMQETTFPVEIFIHDDASSDGTDKIVHEYAVKYPALFWTVVQKENQWSKGNVKIISEYLAQQRGEFIALCEGDDYWTRDDKLEKQVSILAHNDKYAGCFHDACFVDGDKNMLKESYFFSDQSDYDQKSVLTKLLSAEPTCALMFRASAVRSLPAWYLRRPSDFYLDILLTRGGGQLHFLQENMAAYRQHSGGFWSGTTKASQVVELIVRLEMLLLEDDFKSSYEKEIRSKISELTSLLLTKLDEKTELENAYRVIKQQAEQLSSAQSGKQASVQQSFIVRLLKRLADSLR
jgi:glycosyltransferase involved in cell wall biosynthesis